MLQDIVKFLREYPVFFCTNNINFTIHILYLPVKSQFQKDINNGKTRALDAA